MRQRFDVTENLEKFCKILETKHRPKIPVVHGKNTEKTKESSSYSIFYCSSVWIKGNGGNHYGGKATTPVLSKE